MRMRLNEIAKMRRKGSEVSVPEVSIPLDRTLKVYTLHGRYGSGQVIIAYSHEEAWGRIDEHISGKMEMEHLCEHEIVEGFEATFYGDI